MNTLPDDRKLLEMLAVFQSAEQGAREICDLCAAIALKYQHRTRQVEQDKQQQVDASDGPD